VRRSLSSERRRWNCGFFSTDDGAGTAIVFRRTAALKRFDPAGRKGMLRMAVREILLLGNPLLFEKSKEVGRDEIDSVRQVVRDLHDTMMDFRARRGWGRAIAAPQIGVMKRIIYLHVDRPVVLINPVLADQSEETVAIWDDCMSFPDLMVRVKRHRTCRIVFRDLDWNEREMILSGGLSELLQHEHDHLEGVLAVMRAIDVMSFAYRSQRVFLT
jgi:peptide deformylase